MTARDAGPSTLSFAGGARVVEDSYAPRRKQERHAHPYTNVSLVLAGSVEETVGGALERAYALSVVVKPGGTEHADQYGAQGGVSNVLYPHERRGYLTGASHLHSTRIFARSRTEERCRSCCRTCDTPFGRY